MYLPYPLVNHKVHQEMKRSFEQAATVDGRPMRRVSQLKERERGICSLKKEEDL